MQTSYMLLHTNQNWLFKIAKATIIVYFDEGGFATQISGIYGYVSDNKKYYFISSGYGNNYRLCC